MFVHAFKMAIWALFKTDFTTRSAIHIHFQLPVFIIMEIDRIEWIHAKLRYGIPPN
jgi:hypothetical protein